MRNITKSPWVLIIGLYLFRLLNAFSVTTFLFPDEWWQFGEPAHVVIHGYGYLTWDWRAGIRSYVTVLPLMALMWITKVCGIGSEWMARHGGKVVMAGWMALTDFYTYKLAGKLFGPAVQPYALLFSVFSGFHASRSIRSLSNNVEMALGTVGMFYLPIRRGEGNFRAMLMVVGVACLVRITAVMFWMVPVLLTLKKLPWKDWMISIPLIVAGTVSFGVLVDSFFYGRWTVSWWNFYVWNVVRGVSEQYGRESPLYHVKVTLPLMVNTQAGYLMVGLWRGAWRRGWLGVIAAVFLGLSSTVQRHKETRFLAPIYPLILVVCAYGGQQLSVLTSKKHAGLAKVFLMAVLGSQVLIGWFYGCVHFNGAYAIMEHLRGLVDKQPDSSVFFLTPCHVTPFQGYLHRKGVVMGFVKCHPREVDAVMPRDESDARDRFEEDPGAFIESDVIGRGYAHLVLFESNLRDYSDLISQLYVECARVDNSLLAIGSNKRRGDLLIYCKK